MRSLILAAGILAFAAGPALAQSSAGQSGDKGAQMGSNPENHGSTSQSSRNIRKTLQHDLRKAGFTDIKVMPEAFAVHAKNSAGQPVFMLISPDSLTEITPVAMSGQIGGQNTHENGSNANNTANAGGNSNQ